VSQRRSIEEHTQNGKKIMAIKLYREQTRQGLLASKLAVEHFMAHGSWSAEHLQALGEGAQASPPASPPTSGSALDLSAAERFAAAHKKIHAIKELRRVMPMGLKDAKETVEHFMAQGTWPASLLQKTPSQPSAPPPQRTRRPAAAPAPSPAPRKPAPTTTPQPAAKAAVAADPKAAAAVEALIEHIGALPIDRFLTSEKNLARGYLASSGARVFFLVTRFGSWAVDSEYSSADDPVVQVRTNFSRVELHIRVGYRNDTFTGLSEADAQTIAALLS